MIESNSPNSSDESSRASRIRGIIDDCLLRWANGEDLSDASVMGLYPELMPDLAVELRKARIVGLARRNGDKVADDESGSVIPETRQLADPDSGSAAMDSGSANLHIRCPHCRNPVELLVDTPFNDITCESCGSCFSIIGDEEPPSGPVPLKTVGHFQLLSRLGLGGFGTVWKARDTILDRTVAVKIPRRGQLDAQQQEQFLREARVAAQLTHRHIVSVHEVGRDGETIYIVSDFIRGTPLSTWLADKRPTFRETAELCAKVAEALHYAHSSGIVHRDLKPSNIMIDEQGEPHVMDFGLAKRAVGEITMTVDGQILGTPAYMPPEQAAGEAHYSDSRSDVYSLGVTLFQMLTGDLPFRGDAQMLVHQVIHDEAPSPRKLNAHVPRDLETICLKCLEKSPDKRFFSAQQLANELQRFVRDEPIRSRPITRATRVWRWCRRNPVAACLAATILVVAIVGPVVAIYQRSLRQHIERLHSDNVQLIQNLSQERDQLETDYHQLRQQWDRQWSGLKDRQPIDKRLAELARDHYLPYVHQLAQETVEPIELAHAYLGMALITRQSGQRQEANELFEKAGALLDGLVASEPANTDYRGALADCYVHLGQLQREIGNPDDAFENFQRAHKIRESLAIDSPETIAFHKALAETYVHLARLQRESEEPTVALKTLTKAEDAAEKIDTVWPDDPVALYLVACVLTRNHQWLHHGDPAEANGPTHSQSD